MFKYTICLIKKDDKLLLLNRSKKPAMGVWNGVGGKIKENETPFEGVIRETYEETGIQIKDVTYAGNVVLNSEVGSSGIYIFIAELPEHSSIQPPVNTEEGILDWKSIEWILDEDNIGIISHLKCCLPLILEGNYDLEHTFLYDVHNILDYTTSKITENEIYKKYRKIPQTSIH